MLPFDPESLCRQCNVPDPADFVSRSARLYELLNAANRKINLTRIQSENDYWIKHVADSLLIAEYFPKLASEALRIADIGCGAGFPSLILAAAFPALRKPPSIRSAKRPILSKTRRQRWNWPTSK